MAGASAITESPPQSTTAVSLSLCDAVGVIALYGVLRSWLKHHVPLSFASYEQPVLFVAELQHGPTLLWYACCLVGAVLAGRRMGWSQWDGYRPVRGFVVCVALTCAWAFALYDVNVYLDQLHLWDRLLVLALAAGVWFHPLWLGPWLVHTMTMVHQFQVPLQAFPWTDKALPFGIVTLFVALMTYSLWRRQGLDRFVALALMIAGANYFWAGYEKLAIGWQWHEDLSDLLVNSYMNGWGRWWSEAELDWFADLSSGWNGLLIAIVISSESAGLILASGRRIAIAVLCLCALLHVGIFAASGICFWKWLVVDVALVLLLATSSRDFLSRVFGPVHRWTIPGLILLFPLYGNSLSLAWFDTPLSHQFEIELVAADGRSVRLPRSYFAPYDFTFSQNRFGFLSREPVLVGTYGVTGDALVATAADEVETPRELDQLLAARGRHEYSSAKSRRLALFLQRFVENAEAWGDWRTFRLVPHHIWTQPVAEEEIDLEGIVSIQVIRRDRVWDEERGRVILLDESVVARWPLDPDPSP